MSVSVLAINAGSSSLKAAIFSGDGRRLLDVRLTGLYGSPRLSTDGSERTPEPRIDGPAAALAVLFAEIASHDAILSGVGAIAHRVAHGGPRYAAPMRIDAEVIAELERMTPYAPLHNPLALAAIRAARAALPGLPDIAVFDTAFHSTLPTRAREYALPKALRERHAIRRFGFHGISHGYAAGRAAAHLGIPVATLRMITLHLGSGASACAIEYGRSIDTSMGMTPLEGLIMATRSGDIDAGVLLSLLEDGVEPKALDDLLNREAGLVGLAGTADMASIEVRAASGDRDAQLAIQLYGYRVRKYVGAYAAALGGVDAIVFTGGVGEHSAVVRHRVANRLAFLGAVLDEDRNRDAAVTTNSPVAEISATGSRCRLLVVATDEEAALAAAARGLLASAGPRRLPRTIPVAVSARHVHLTQASVEQLFGPGHQLAVYRPISQPGQFASTDTVTVVGPRGRIEHVRVLGPVRASDQVEISRTDEFALGLDAPVRESGDLAQTPGCRLEGPAGSVTLQSGVICALRHIHMSPADAAEFGVHDGEVVDVAIEGGARELAFGGVKVRVSERFVLEMHVDTDEGNAAGLGGVPGSVLEAVAPVARLVGRPRG